MKKADVLIEKARGEWALSAYLHMIGQAQDIDMPVTLATVASWFNCSKYVARQVVECLEEMGLVYWYYVPYRQHKMMRVALTPRTADGYRKGRYLQAYMSRMFGMVASAVRENDDDSYAEFATDAHLHRNELGWS